MKSCKNCNEYTCGSQGSDNVSMVCGQNENENLMTDREKLIELLLAGMGFTDNKQLLIPTSELYHLADYLISNGVVVRDKGEWIDAWSRDGNEYIGDGCDHCGHNNTENKKFLPIVRSRPTEVEE